MRGSNPPKPGWHPGTPEETYRAWDCCNASTLKKLRLSPRHALDSILNPIPPTPPMIVGSALHCALLEPQLFEDRFALKLDGRTKEGKKLNALAAERNITLLTGEQYGSVQGMADSVKAKNWYGLLFEGKGDNEASIVWIDRTTGLRCKARLDRVTELSVENANAIGLGADLTGSQPWRGGSVIVDIKKTQDASPDGFAKACARYGYHLQASHYLSGMSALAKRARRFLFVAVESSPPYESAVYELDGMSLEQGAQEVEDAMQLYRACKTAEVWPGYPESVQRLSLPRWAIKEKDWVKGGNL